MYEPPQLRATFENKIEGRLGRAAKAFSLAFNHCEGMILRR